MNPFTNYFPTEVSNDPYAMKPVHSTESMTDSTVSIQFDSSQDDLSSSDEESYRQQEWRSQRGIRHRDRHSDSCQTPDMSHLSLNDYRRGSDSKHKESRIAKRKTTYYTPLLLGGFLLFFFGVAAYQIYQKPLSRRRHFRIRRHPQWIRVVKELGPLIRNTIQNRGEQKTFTIRLSGSRADLLKHSLDAHAHCPLVSHIQIVSSANDLPHNVLHHESGKVLSADQTLETDAVLLLVEDVAFTCNELQRAFQIWTGNADRMVGFFPYRHKNFESNDSPWKLQAVSSGSAYSLLSDRAAFVHKMYLGSFRNHEKTDPCNSVGLSVRVTSISNKPPIVVASKPVELRSSTLIRELKDSFDAEKHDRSERCLVDWVEGHGMPDLPIETVEYLGLEATD